MCPVEPQLEQTGVAVQALFCALVRNNQITELASFCLPQTNFCHLILFFLGQQGSI
jgi:hypothetical protein